MILVTDEAGRGVATLDLNAVDAKGRRGRWSFSSSTAGRLMASWVTDGVPSIEGVQDGDVIIDRPTTTGPDDPLFMLALEDHLDRIGWSMGDASTVVNTRWAFSSDVSKVKAFQAWLQAQLGDTVLSDSEEAAWEAYVLEGFKKGAGRAFDDVRKSKLTKQHPELFTKEAQDSLQSFYAGTKQEFLSSSFAQPESVEKVKLLAGRAFDDLEGVTADMSLKMSRALTDGLVQGKGATDIAEDLADVVDVGKQRAEVVARTEIIRAHAEGQLQSFEALDVEDVDVAAEWDTAGDGQVCELCKPLEGVVLKVDEAHGMLPRHPNCRCAWLPANVGEDPEGQKRSKEDVESAFLESGVDKDELDLDDDRPVGVLNASPNERRLSRWQADALYALDRRMADGYYGDHYVELGKRLLLNYDPNQERDEHGRWVKGPGLPPEKMPTDPVFLTSNPVIKSVNEADAAALKMMAESGDLQGLKGFPASKSPKLSAYKDELTQKLEEHQNEGAAKAKASKAVQGHSTSEKVPELHELEFVKDLPGSTHPYLTKDDNGNQWVVKSGQGKEEQIKNEEDANNAYRTLGVNVPESSLKQGDNGIYKISEFLAHAETLKDWEQKASPNQVKAIHQEIAKNFVADALLSNWDVVGLDKDNIMISSSGTVYRIDNGGALKYRAQGSPKGDLFGPKVLELETMRDHAINPQTAAVYKHLTEEDIKGQIKSVLSKKEAVLAAVKDDSVRKVLSQRFDHLESKLGVHAPPKTSTPNVVLPVKSPNTTPPAPSSVHPLHTAEGLLNHIKANPSSNGAKYTDLHLSKIKALNPEGIKNGVVLLPKHSGATNMSSPSYVNLQLQKAHLTEIIPPTVKVAVQKITKKELSELTTTGGKAAPKVEPGQQPVKVVSHMPAPTAAGVHVLKKMEDLLSPQNKSWANSLTIEESSAVAHWKSGNQKTMRIRIGNGEPQATDLSFLSAAAKAPPFEGTLYRGLHRAYSSKKEDYTAQEMKKIASFGVGGEWIDNAPHGLSRNPSTSAGFSQGHLLLRVRTKTARSIENSDGYKHESEIIGMPKTRYKIVGIHNNVKVKDENGIHHSMEMLVDLEEI